MDFKDIFSMMGNNNMDMTKMFAQGQNNNILNLLPMLMNFQKKDSNSEHAKIIDKEINNTINKLFY